MTNLYSFIQSLLEWPFSELFFSGGWLWNQYKFIAFNIFSSRIFIISCKTLKITVTSTEATNQLTICAILYWNVTIFYRQELPSLIHVQEKLEAFQNKLFWVAVSLRVTIISSVIRQKGESQNGCFKKDKACQIFRKTNISYPLIRTCAYQGVRNVRFSENLACFVFFETPVLRFALLPYYRRYDSHSQWNSYSKKFILKCFQFFLHVNQRR